MSSSAPAPGSRVLLLASASPRRRALLGLLGLPYTTTTADLDETPLPGERPGPYTERLSREKAAKAANAAPPGALVIAADTTVADGDEILGKPADPAEARAMLARLRGRTHQVYTALTVQDAATGRAESDVAAAEVEMRPYSDAELDAYIATGDPFDKAGGYAIQHAAFHPARVAAGCYGTVVGLPLCHLIRLLRAFDVAPAPDARVHCQRFDGHECELADAIRAALGR